MKINKGNILQVLPSLKSGGIERGVTEVNKFLVKSNFQSFVLSAGGNMVYKIEKDGGKHIRLGVHGKNIFSIFFNIFKIVKIIKENKIDIVHARSRAPAWSCYFACKITKCKFITTVHGNYSMGSFPFKFLKKLYNSSMVRGDRVIVVSNYIKEYANINYKAFRNKITSKNVRVIHRGVDVELFNPESVRGTRIIDLQRELSLPDEKVIIFLPGRLTEWKGQMYLIQALSKVKNKNYFCLISGDDKGHKDYKRKLQKEILKHNLSSYVRITDNISDISSAYMLSDIVLSTSIRGEAFGRVAPEGQAMKRYVIATSIGGSLETIIDGKTGFLVPHNNSKKLAEAIEKALNLSDVKRAAIGDEAQRHIRENFTIDVMCEKIISVYKELL